MIRADWLELLQEWADDWRAGRAQAWADGRFAEAQAQLLNWQMAHIAGFAAFARTRPAGRVPFVPVTAFKAIALAADYVPAGAAIEFHTSGTSDGQPGRIRLLDATAYDVSLLAGFRHFMVPEPDLRLRCISLVPTAAVRPHSSLGHMTQLLFRHLDDGHGGWFLGQALDVDGLRAALLPEATGAGRLRQGHRSRQPCTSPQNQAAQTATPCIRAARNPRACRAPTRCVVWGCWSSWR